MRPTASTKERGLLLRPLALLLIAILLGFVFTTGHTALADELDGAQGEPIAQDEQALAGESEGDIETEADDVESEADVDTTSGDSASGSAAFGDTASGITETVEPAETPEDDIALEEQTGPKDISGATVSSIPAQNYAGSPVKPAFTVTFEGNTLVEGTDYTVTYSNNNAPGTATATITGCGIYEGEQTVNFTINPRKGTWKKNSRGWWYDWGGGQYPKSSLEEIDGEKYYFNASGYMVTGWQKVDGKWYYFKPSGAAAKGWQKVGGKWYYLDPSTGVMKTGWLDNGGKKYYLNSSGAMVTGWQKIGGKWYWFNSSGAMTKGWQKVGGKWYYLDPSTGVMKTGWLDNGGKKYYLNSSGAMVTGWQKIGGKWYLFNSSGAMTKGWQKSGGKWYYMDGNGVMKTGWLKDGGKWYYLNSSGAMATGWKKIGGKWYWFNSSGAMATGWQKVNGCTFYFNPSTGEMLSGKQYIDGKWYDLDPNYGLGDSLMYSMCNRARGYSSPTNWLVLVDVTHCRVGIFHWSGGQWNLEQYWQCTCGRSNRPTCIGTYYIGAKGYSFGHGPGQDPNPYTCYYYTQFNGDYLFHSVLYHWQSDKIRDGRLGQHLSAGCVRLDINNAKWLQDHVPYNSKVVTYL